MEGQRWATLRFLTIAHKLTKWAAAAGVTRSWHPVISRWWCLSCSIRSCDLEFSGRCFNSRPPGDATVQQGSCLFTAKLDFGLQNNNKSSTSFKGGYQTLYLSDCDQQIPTNFVLGRSRVATPVLHDASTPPARPPSGADILFHPFSYLHPHSHHTHTIKTLRHACARKTFRPQNDPPDVPRTRTPKA